MVKTQTYWKAESEEGHGHVPIAIGALDHGMTDVNSHTSYTPGCLLQPFLAEEQIDALSEQGEGVSVKAAC